ncbi:lysine-specific histone demethylase 1 homolog 2 [Impatiens glandulifera]|uniref:lysine-specific histone demethylase 1 homolog 2 n=1 Tax=Impatiens glandulifera TaxID=253017 RepID=UPI001FB09EE8|nr:lysine-specific histone demethylase 1 homolog 2 [Impatiens glandulifera]
MMGTPVSEGSVVKRSLRKRAAVRNYDENLMDELMEKHFGGPFKKRTRTQVDLEKETETEAMLALSLGFPIDELLEEEVQARVVNELGGKDQNDYIVVRNHILGKWRGNVGVWLSKDQFRETVSNEFEHLLSSAYDFLLHNGYINFGVSLPFTSHVPEDSAGASVIIVGAGLAGLAAARQLLSFGFKVIILEGRKRPGGRVYSQKMGQKGNYAVVDLGGSVITGIHANPLGVLARQLSIPLHKIRGKCPLYKPNGTPVVEETDSKVELIFNKLLDKVTECRKIMGGTGNVSLGFVLETLTQLYAVAKTTEERQLLDWHFANLEYANAGCLSSLSAAYWDQDDPYEMGGDHCFLAGGNWGLVKSLAEGVPIFYGKSVSSIRYGEEEGVEVVVTGDQVFKADMVICTVPLGVLKKKVISFKPELPDRKLAAIERLGFGSLNKVAMVFPYVFWGEDLDTFGSLNEHSHSRGEFFLFYSYHTVSGGPLLIALVAGDAALTFESTDPSVLLHTVLQILRGIYGRKGIDVPNPIQTICTRWGSDNFSFGSYSHVSVKSSGSDYDIMAESVDDRLFFAGEATNRQHPATMHGAFLSGLREASRILQSTRSRKIYPRKCLQKFETRFEDLFKCPDFEFGRFSFLFDPLAEDPKSMGIMRVIFEKTDLEPLMLYTALTRQHMEEVKELNGGDECKLLFIFKSLGLKLMGANAIRILANSLIVNITSYRRGRGRNRTIAGPLYVS